MQKTVQSKREMIGDATDMYTFSSALLEKPGSKREMARRAVFPGVPNESLRQSLCNEINNTMYKETIFTLAQELGLPVTRTLTKKELCDMISRYVIESQIPVPSVEPLILAEKNLKKNEPWYLLEIVTNSDELFPDIVPITRNTKENVKLLENFLNDHKTSGDAYYLAVRNNEDLKDKMLNYLEENTPSYLRFRGDDIYRQSADDAITKLNDLDIDQIEEDTDSAIDHVAREDWRTVPHLLEMLLPGVSYKDL